MLLRKVSPMQMEQVAQNNAPANQLANAIQNNAGIIDIRTGAVVDELYPLPDSTTFSVDASSAANSTAIKVWVFNEDVLKSTIEDNTYVGAPNKPTLSYNDGFDGRLINGLIKNFRNGRGMRISEITVIGKDASDVQQDSAIMDMDLRLVAYNATRGSEQSKPYDLSEALRNTQFKDGMVTVKVDLMINAVSQLEFYCPLGYAYELRVKWDYSDLK